MVIVLFAVAIYALWKSGEWARQDVKIAKTLDDKPESTDFSFRFRDVAINPRDGTAIVVGSDASILTFTDTRTYPYSGGKRNDLHSVAFSGDGTTAVAVGEGGLVLVSTDNGRSWSPSHSATEKDFSDVVLSGDGRTIVAVGEDGLILVSVDGGKQWTEQGNVTPKDLNAVALSETGETAVAVGDDETILIWTDFGKDRKPVSVSGDAKRDFNAVAFGPDAGTAVVVGDDGAVLVSGNIATSGGNPNWNERGGNDRSDGFEAVAFSSNGRTAIAVGRRGAVRFSTDGGRTWEPGTSSVGDRFRAVALDDDGTAVAVGDDGTILISTDLDRNRGGNWIFRDSRTASRLTATAHGFGSNRRDVIAVGEDSTIFRLKHPAYELVPGPSLAGLSEAFEKGGDGRAPQSGGSPSETEDDGFGVAYLVNLVIVCTGTVLIILLMVAYLTGLGRYCLRLAAFYDARGDAVRLAGCRKEVLQPGNIGELEQMMHALTPYGLDFGRPYRAMADMAMQMAQLIGRGGSTVPGSSSAGSRKE